MFDGARRGGRTGIRGAAAAGTPRSMKPRMSCLVTRPANPVPGNPGDVHLMLGRDLPDQRRGLPAEPFLGGLVAVARAAGRSARRRPRPAPPEQRVPAGLLRTGVRHGDGRGGGAARRGAAAERDRRRQDGGALLGLDHRHQGLHRNGLALLHLDLDQRPGGRRGNLGVHLVGGDLEEGLVPLHLIPDVLQPLTESPFGNGLSHLGHEDVYPGHGISSRDIRRQTSGLMSDV